MQKNVEEQEFNDSSLLEELEELEESNDIIESEIKDLQEKILQEKETYLELKNNGNLTQSNKLLHQIQELESKKKNLEIKLKQSSQVEEIAEQEKNLSKEKIQQILKQRMDIYKQSIIEAKNSKDLDQENELMKYFKQLKSAKESLDRGEIIDITNLPNENPNLYKKSKFTQEKVVKGRTDTLSLLEAELKKKYEVAKTRALNAGKKGNKQVAQQQLNITKQAKSELEFLIKAKGNPEIPLLYHFDTYEYIEERSNEDLKDTELEIKILSCKNLNPDNTSSHIYLLFPYPNSESFQAASSCILTNSDINYSMKFSIERKKSFQIFCERKKISLELYQRKLLLLSNLLGKGEIRLSALLDKCQFIENVEIKAGRKVLCVLEIELRIRNPLLKKDLEKFVEKFVIIDEKPNSSDNVSTEEKKKFPETSLSSVVSETEEDYLNNIDNIISNDVLEWELNSLTSKMDSFKQKNQEPPEELSDKKSALEFKLNLLQTQASTGQLDQEKYLVQLKEKILFEKSLANKLSKSNKKVLAATFLRRVKIMEKEVEATIEM